MFSVSQMRRLFLRPSESESPTSFSNYMELIVTIIPKRSDGLRQKLRGACGFLPMPISLGWEMDPLQEEVPPDLLVPGLMLTDIASGATRRVEALWMHILYRQVQEEHPMKTTSIRLHEIGFTRRMGFAHFAILTCVLFQFLLGLIATGIYQRRESLLIFLGLLLRVVEGQFSLACPPSLPPRSVNRQRPCALHTGTTTTHITILTHDPVYSPQQPLNSSMYINLEDCAVPLPRTSTGRQAIVEKLLTTIIRVTWWAYKFTIFFTSSNGLMIPITLFVGFVVTEAISNWVNCTPRCRISEPVSKEPSILDMIAAACHQVNAVSVGFVEAILPDPTGEHVDYKWIKGVMEKGALVEGIHPSHQIKNKIFSAAMQRIHPRDREWGFEIVA